MTLGSWAWLWLIRATLSGLVTLTVGAAAAGVCRQPVRRLRILRLTAIGCLLVPGIAALPGIVRVPLHSSLFESALRSVPDQPAVGGELPAGSSAEEGERGVP